MLILNIAGYKFIELTNLQALRTRLLEKCQALGLKGTILLSQEGINVNLSGEPAMIALFLPVLTQEPGLADLKFHRTYSESHPYQSMKVKIKKEIITIREPLATPNSHKRAPSLSPKEFKQWLDEKKADQRNFTVLDTRNRYEVEAGTYDGALHLNLNHFSEFPQAVQTLDKQTPVVMFCTGGIRCEKAALWMIAQGFSEVYQLDGGILGYFAQVGGEHFTGDCFVFDERLTVHANQHDFQAK